MPAPTLSRPCRSSRSLACILERVANSWTKPSPLGEAFSAQGRNATGAHFARSSPASVKIFRSSSTGLSFPEQCRKETIRKEVSRDQWPPLITGAGRNPQMFRRGRRTVRGEDIRKKDVARVGNVASAQPGARLRGATVEAPCAAGIDDLRSRAGHTLRQHLRTEKDNHSSSLQLRRSCLSHFKSVTCL